jgi:hypothetical protein
MPFLCAKASAYRPSSLRLLAFRLRNPTREMQRPPGLLLTAPTPWAASRCEALRCLSTNWCGAFHSRVRRGPT